MLASDHFSIAFGNFTAQLCNFVLDKGFVKAITGLLLSFFELLDLFTVADRLDELLPILPPFRFLLVSHALFGFPFFFELRLLVTVG